MKKELFILFILLINLVIAQEEIELVPKSDERLDVKYHSFGGQYTIDLKKYLGEGSYRVSETKNVNIDINQETGLAIISSQPGWQGSEIIRFTLNKTKSITTLPKETFEEIKPEIEKLEVFQDAFDGVIKDIAKEKIKRLDSEFRNNKLFISVNEEVNLIAGYDENLKPQFNFGISLSNEGIESPPGFFESINLSLITSIIIIIILLFVFRNNIINLLIIKENKKSIKKSFLARLVKYKDDDEKILDLTESFFFRFLKIKKYSSLYILDLALEKRNIQGDLKQEIISLFKHLQKEEYNKKEIKHIYESLRRVLIKL
ncbi:MAG: hypothetical protein QGF74_00665 [Candidatus Nanoarchaeia archaeon]|jgi:hypothetical protein|nr:hypothetical protein [Candidatus Nanoarchaeia archaeon]|tara:strand:+ start:2859 stop:3806 length:948 start_codon:yes stop_codon:yes gene_type:complete